MKTFFKEIMPYGVRATLVRKPFSRTPKKAWVVYNRSYEQIGVCEIPDTQIEKIAIRVARDPEGRITEAWFYDDATTPEKLGELDKKLWFEYVEKLTALASWKKR